ncbi:putative envelope protein ODV-E66-14 [Microplitis demolitor]|uniref:putative envelope protein ODV-E66-14 n=1 Tax=Microplitis demolitor TaxID=69319 RepID=UPI000440032C|nr:putative envelope protein ODV-E66-14 [Microplitis demolitor]KAG6558315.1 putative envelope protein ODV-E66-14 [Microplitis demolitor]
MEGKHLILFIQIFFVIIVFIVLITLFYKIDIDILIPKDKVFAELINSKISDEDYKIVKEFEKKNVNYLTNASLDFDTLEKFVSLCDFAVRILIIYHKNRESKIYIQLVDDIIKKLNEQIFSKNKYDVLKSGGDVNIKALVHLMRLLNTFEYVADNEYNASKKICHDNIIKIIPETNKVGMGVEVSYNDEKAIYTIIPRLLTYYLIPDKKEYNKDANLKNGLVNLKSQFNVLNTTPEKRQDFLLYDYHYSLYKTFSETGIH